MATETPIYFKKEQVVFLNSLTMDRLLVLLHDIYYATHTERHKVTMLDWQLFSTARDLGLTWDGGKMITKIIRERL